jgi:hypothetical protein
MKRPGLYISVFLALLVCAAATGATSARAQTRDKYLISAKAGGINYISGNVTVNRRGTGGQQTLTDQDNLEDGDVVTTGAGGRVEVLLNPGSYMRVAENSEFEFADTSLERLRINLLRGSAIIEVVGEDDYLELKVETPQASANIFKRGIYRINVPAMDRTEFIVRKGRALVVPPAQEIKSGKMIIISRGMTEIAKIDKRLEDSLDLWSRERAEYLASINRQMQPSVLSASLSDYTDDWMYGSWAYDRRRNCYVYVPGRGGASSPYGYGYRNWGGRECRCVNGRENRPPSTTPPAQPPNQDGGDPVGSNDPPPTTTPPTREDNPRGSDSPAPMPARNDPPASYSPPPPSSPPPSSPPTSAPSGTAAPMTRENPN